jgi:hypothetical protein
LLSNPKPANLDPTTLTCSILALGAGVGLRACVRPDMETERLVREGRVAAHLAVPGPQLLVHPLLVIAHFPLRVERLAANVAGLVGARQRFILRAAAAAAPPAPPPFPLLFLLARIPLSRDRLLVKTLHVFFQLILRLVGPAAVGTEERALFRMRQLVLLHDGGGEAAVFAAVAGDELQVLAVLAPQVKAALLPRGKFLAALGTLVLVRPAVRDSMYLQVDRILGSGHKFNSKYLEW